MPDPTEWEYTYNGLTFGGATAYGLERVEGLNPPDIRIAETEKMEDHGAFIDARYLRPRVIVFEGDVFGEHEDGDFATKINDLRKAFRPQAESLPLKVHLPEEGVRRINCKPRRNSFPVGMGYSLGLETWTVELIAEDPRIYSDAEDSLVLTPFVPNGMVFPEVFDMTFGGGSGGAGPAVNDGIFDTPPFARIDGPVTNPQIINQTAGKRVELDTEIDSGHYIEIDFASRTVMLDGTASRYGTLTDDSEWWYLEEGSNSIQFLGAGAGSVTLTWRDAWV